MQATSEERRQEMVVLRATIRASIPALPGVAFSVTCERTMRDVVRVRIARYTPLTGRGGSGASATPDTPTNQDGGA